MAWDSCRQEVESTGDKMCDVNLCAKSQAGVDKKCHDKGWPAGTPFGIYLPDGSVCFCCCSCFAYDTPIQVSTDTFKAIQDFVPGDPVLAAGADLKWKTYKVDLSSGIGPTGTELFMVYVRYGNPGEEVLELIVTEDHLFLLAGGKLAPASALKAGDKLIRPDGGSVAVEQAYLGTYRGGVHHISTGKFDGSLEGHLLNSNNIVTTDKSVKLEYQTGSLDKDLLADDLDKRAKVGSEAYAERYYDKEAKTFMANPTEWPEGFTVVVRQDLVNIPDTAYRFITDDQARNIMDSGAPRRDFDSNAAIMKIQYVFRQFQGFHPEPMYLMDWNNPIPNGYAFNYYNQNIILLTGGLLRLYALNNEGFALIICHLLARLFGIPGIDKSIKCVGPADYEAVAGYFTGIYQAQQFPNQFPNALKQIQDFFNLMSEKYRKGDPNDRCNAPTTECRIQTYLAAAAVQPLPKCADPGTKPFHLVKAVPSEKTDRVTVVYSEALNPPTAETIGNYSLAPGAEITEAKVNPDNDSEVILSVTFQEDTEYVLTVSNVLSEFNDKMVPDPAEVKFKLL
jgi:hypothetical protein